MAIKKEKSSLFYSSMKTELPNVSSCTSFKKHLLFLVDQNQNGEKICITNNKVNILRVFNKIFNVSEGSCSTGCWFQLIRINCLFLTEDINSNFFEDGFIILLL